MDRGDRMKKREKRKLEGESCGTRLPAQLVADVERRRGKCIPVSVSTSRDERQERNR